MNLRTRHGQIHLIFIIYGILGYLFLYVPVFLLILFSFNESAAGSLPFTGLTLKWYRDLLADFLVINAFWTSLKVALAASILSTIIGTAAAFPMARLAFRFKETLRIIFTLPIMVPGLLIGIALLIFFSSWLDLNLSLVTVIIGHVVFTTPFVVLVVTARLLDFDYRLEWAAADLGATPFQTFRQVTFPLIFPGVLAGALFAFTLSLDEFIITFFTIGPQSTLPMYIFSQVKFGITPKINALATILFVGSIIILGGTFYMLTRRESKNSEIIIGEKNRSRRRS
jgi:ABC-type spermidine/putrescine transport system permease subunit II